MNGILGISKDFNLNRGWSGNISVSLRPFTCLLRVPGYGLMIWNLFYGAVTSMEVFIAFKRTIHVFRIHTAYLCAKFRPARTGTNNPRLDIPQDQDLRISVKRLPISSYQLYETHGAAASLFYLTMQWNEECNDMKGRKEGSKYEVLVERNSEPEF